MTERMTRRQAQQVVERFRRAPSTVGRRLLRRAQQTLARRRTG